MNPPIFITQTGTPVALTSEYFRGKSTWISRAEWQVACDKIQESIKKLNRQRRKAVNKGRRNRAKKIDVRIDALKAEIVAITLANK